MQEYEKFCRAYKNLAECINTETPYNVVTSAGLVGLFKLTFEQSWKMIKEILEYHGYEQSSTGSQRIVIKTAYQAGMITDEEIALAIIKETKEIYTGMFLKLKETVEENWLK